MTLIEQAPARWPLERALFALTGTVTLLSIVLGGFVSKWFLLAAALAGVGQLLYVTVGLTRGRSSCIARAGCARRSTRTRANHLHTRPRELVREQVAV